MMRVSALIFMLSILCLEYQDVQCVSDEANAEVSTFNLVIGCYDCFKEKYPSMYCSEYLYYCELRNETTDPDSFNSYTNEALNYRSYLSFESSMRREAANSAYCRYYLGFIKDPTKFCHEKVGSKLFMTASYLASLVSDSIKNEFRADSVETVLVAVQKQDDTRSEKKFLRRLMKKARSAAVGRQLDLHVQEHRTLSRPGIASVRQVPMTEGKRTWSVHLAKNMKKDGDKSNVLGEFRLAIRLYADGFYLHETAKIRSRSGNYFIVSVDTSPVCTNVFC